ncbi:pyridoxamine 5'-phosphate oxidase family protein [Nakamurella lactea]|uniref:pyridoxamine 5'-phosphate oxidase family protein n=1 Tax=Nakamurella lactea TaxID=459515 RepID=UPI0004097B6D|nr:pyridoxamine 5'-phosphate oxidase family protein [Nakamurella lactea]
MSEAERDEFLATERTCRVATVGAHGPHATALWFLWHGGKVWIYSLTRSQRWADVMSDPRIGLVVDAGHEYEQLCGVEITGRVAQVGEVPRTGEPVAALEIVEKMFSAKYFGGAAGGGTAPDGTAMNYDGKHAWLRLDPDKIVSWDFRKIPAGPDVATSG